ncbi:solute carrier family 15 member 1-like [Centruroides sculpturatus]|uniref:solute carrier family 15 member 1-like n=1 Tax=Centruroides sculpturatus TaxID=218467 RepID=UPI000C6D257D|nr:solute carrier family 15 member 1-like [Centruroides sculpturatus]
MDEKNPLLQNKKTVLEREKISYPKAIFFILILLFGESLFFSSLQNTFILYFTEELLYSDNTGTNIYHGFTMTIYFFCLVGAIVADSVLGKFRTLLYSSILTVIGCVIISLSSVPNFLPMRSITMVSLVVIVIGIGGTKPCLSSFGGDQFKPNQKTELQRYFSFHVMIYKTGTLMSSFIIPILRAKVHCFGESTCYPLAFGFNSIILILTLVIFIFGHPSYKINPPSKNVLFEGFKCTIHAIIRKIKLRKVVTKKDWLDYADDKFDRQLIYDIKRLFRIISVFLFLPMISAVHYLRFSSFILQATKLDNRVLGFKIEADQLQVIVAVLGILYIPIFEYIVYPIFNKCNLLTRSLQKIVVGCILITLSCILAAFLQLSLEKHHSNCDDIYRFTIVNYTPCDVNIDIPINSLVMEDYQIKTKVAENESVHGLNLAVTKCSLSNEEINYNIANNKPLETTVILSIHRTNSTIKENEILQAFSTKINYDSNVDNRRNATNTDSDIINIAIGSGDIYKLTAYADQNGKLDWKQENKSKCNSLSILLQIPQYIIIAAGDTIFFITIQEFAYSEAPQSMKSILQSFFWFQSAFGNFIILIIQQMNFVEESHKLFFYIGLAVLDIMVLILVTYKYKYRNDVIRSETPSTKKQILSNGN